MTKNEKTDLRGAITDKILTALKAGVAPWVKPWTGGNGLPVNITTGKAYRGVNRLLLSWIQYEKGYPTSEWLTFKQCRALGGSVLPRPDDVERGEWGHRVIFWKFITKVDAAGEECDAFPLLKSYTVFNRAQTTGLPEPEVVEVPDHERHAHAEATIAATGAEINYGGDRAFYDRSYDRIQVPSLSSFHNVESFYSTTFHELAHWTGAKKRLNREKGKNFGDKIYAREELIAELAAAFLCGEHRISGALQHEGYIANWIRALESDNNFIFSASSQAQKAADLINGPQEEAKVAA
jgi:antirestriction protein ArdC